MLRRAVSVDMKSRIKSGLREGKTKIFLEIPKERRMKALQKYPHPGIRPPFFRIRSLFQQRGHWTDSPYLVFNNCFDFNDPYGLEIHELTDLQYLQIVVPIQVSNEQDEKYYIHCIYRNNGVAQYKSINWLENCPHLTQFQLQAIRAVPKDLAEAAFREADGRSLRADSTIALPTIDEMDIDMHMLAWCRGLNTEEDKHWWTLSSVGLEFPADAPESSEFLGSCNWI